MLAAAMVRHQEPVGKGGVRATVAEIYPIAWETRGEYLDASVDAGTGDASSLREGDRFEIYQNGWQVGWFDVNRIAPKPYPGGNKLVGLGGWSLPRRLYPYRLDRKTNLNYLYKSIYDWGSDKYKNSIQPFLALSTQRPSVSSTEFSPAQIKRDLYPVFESHLNQILRGHQGLVKSDLTLTTFKAYDLDNDRVPEVLAVYQIPRDRTNRNLIVVATIEASAYLERYQSFEFSTNWQPLDVIDVDGDDYKEIVLFGKEGKRVSFQVLHGSGGRMKKVFQGASF
jgi:hypothetical protein